MLFLAHRFYLQRHQHRKLLVNSLLGGAEIAAHFYGVVPAEEHLKAPRKYYLSVATQQMVVIDAFNYRDSYTFSVKIASFYIIAV